MSHHVISIVWSLYGVAVLFVFGRLLGRLPSLFAGKSWDDWTMVACMVRSSPMTLKIIDLV